MCNAWNHWSGCTCGFGGEGHLGGGHGGGRGGGPGALSPSHVFFSYGNSMRDLAAALGYSVIFPTICRYCGELIYLYANPDGGFAIFDSLGVPWPKHECWGIQFDAKDYTSFSLVCSSQYSLPVPKNANIIYRKTGKINGVVVSKRISPSIRRPGKYYIFDGKQLFELFSNKNLDIGRFVDGNLEMIDGQSFLREPNGWEGDEPSEATLSKRMKVTSKILRLSNIWDLQADIDRIELSDRIASELLKYAVDALVSGFPLVALLLFSEFVAQKSDALSKGVKASYFDTLLILTEELNLESVIPTLAKRLSKATKYVLDAETEANLTKLKKMAELKLRMVSDLNRKAVFDNQWKKEKKYAESIGKKTGMEISSLHKKFREII